MSGAAAARQPGGASASVAAAPQSPRRSAKCARACSFYAAPPSSPAKAVAGGAGIMRIAESISYAGIGAAAKRCESVRENMSARVGAPPNCQSVWMTSVQARTAVPSAGRKAPAQAAWPEEPGAARRSRRARVSAVRSSSVYETLKGSRPVWMQKSASVSAVALVASVPRSAT
jgi:hypothetical protein